MNAWARRALVLLVALLCGLGSLCARAQGLDLARPEPRLEPGVLLEALADPQSRLEPLQALQEPGWTPATPRQLNPDLSRDLVPGRLWLRLRLVNQGTQSVTRWVAVGSWRIEHMRAYEVEPEGTRVRQAWTGGIEHALRERPVPGVKNIFPVTLQPGQEMVFLAEVRLRLLVRVDLSVWEPPAFREQEAQENLLVLISVGMHLSAAAYFLVQLAARRERVFGLSAMWVLLVALHQLAHHGFIYRYVLYEGGWVEARLRVLSSILLMSVSLFLLYRTLGLYRLLPWRRFFRVLLTGFAAVAVTVAVPWVSPVALGVATVLLILLAQLFTPLSMWAAWRHRLPGFRICLLPYTVWWIISVLRMLQLTVLPLMVSWGDDLIQWTNLALFVMVLHVLLGHYHGTVRDKLNAQAALLRAQAEEQARLERAVQERTRALQDALIAARDANAAKSDFLARVSHDLRTPLTSILGYAGLLSGAGRREAEHGRVILRSAQHLLALLNDLIDYARGGVQPDALQLAPLYTAALLENLAAEGRALAARQGNRFELQVRGPLPLAVEADAKRLRQVLQNLLANAAKFTRGGRVAFEVEVAPAPDEAGCCRFRFAVRDTGPGIEAAVLPHLFEPFQRSRAADRPEGLGLGLAIARQWTERMGGRIAAESRPGEGTCMRVELALRPVSEEAIARPQRMLEQEQPPELDGSGRRLWVVEDSAAVREMLCAELEGLGFEVLALDGGVQALARLGDAAAPAPDLVITDLQMPGADGHAVLAALRARWPALPVVLLSAALESRLREPAGFSAVLGKPVSRAQLRTTLAGLLGLALDGDGGEAAPAAALQPPPPEYLSEFTRLVRLGAVSDVADWAAQLAAAQPPWRGFLERLRALAEQGDLKGCERMLAAPTGAAATEPA